MRVRRISNFGLGVENSKDADRCRDRTLHDDVNFAQRFHRIVEDENATDEGKKAAGTEVGGVDVKECHTNSNSCQSFNQRSCRFHRLDHAHSVPELEHRAT